MALLKERELRSECIFLGGIFGIYTSQKIKHFVWRLLVIMKLHRKGIKVDSICHIYGNIEKTTKHLFIEDGGVSRMWYMSSLRLQWPRQNGVVGESNEAYSYTEHVLDFGFELWWNARNKWMFENKNVDNRRVISKSLESVECRGS